MPASAPWMDYAAPPQYTYFQPTPGDPVTRGQDSGAFARLTGWLSGGLGGLGVNANNSQVDTTLHWKLSGTIILALVVIFGMSAMGFRFVTSANLSLGR